MKRLMSLGVVIALVFTALNVLFGGWDLPIPPVPNQIYALQTGSTLVGIGRALNGRAGTIILNNGGNYVFGWTIKDAWAFACLNSTGTSCAQELSVMQGNLVNVKSMRDVARYLVDNHGWKYVAAEAVPQTVKLMYMEASVLYAAAATGETMFLVVPANAPSMMMPEDYMQILEGMDT